MAPTHGDADYRAFTILFKKHKTTVLLPLQPHEPLSSAKGKLLDALNDRGVKDINGDKVPEVAGNIELGVPVDRSDPGKGWVSIDSKLAAPEDKEDSKGKSKASDDTVLAAGLKDGHSVAFRFIKPAAESSNELDNTHWDVILPRFDDEEAEEEP